MGAQRLCAGAGGVDADRRRAWPTSMARRACWRWAASASALASAACIVAPSIEWLIAARVVQGVCAAILTPASLALIGATYPKAERNRAIGVWAAASALTTAGGPVLGGWLTEAFGWQWVFAINPPLALIAVALLYAAPRDRRERTALRPDGRGDPCCGARRARLGAHPDRTARRERAWSCRRRGSYRRLRARRLTPCGNGRAHIR